MERGPGQVGGEALERREALRLAERSLEGSEAAEALIGFAAEAMSVIALAGVLPSLLGSIATAVLGIAMLFEGAATASRYQRLSAVVPVREHEQAQVGGGLTVEVVGGAAGIALGVLALVGIEPSTLLPIASMVFGAAYVMSGGLHPALETWVERGEAWLGASTDDGRRNRLTHRAVNAGAAARALAGIASAMLGILALAGVGPALTFSLVAMLTLGLAAVVGASAFSARMSTLSHPR
jgi:hypothetical protein